MPTQPNDASPGAHPPSFMRPALRAARAGVWDYDPDDDRMCYCLGTARVLGLPSADRQTGLPLGRIAEIVHPDDRAAYLSSIVALRTHGGALTASFRTSPANGESRSVLLQGRFEAGEDGRRLSGQGVVIDLSGDIEPGIAQDADETDPSQRFAALTTGIDLVIAARKAMTGMDASVLTLADALLMVLGRQLAAALAAGQPDRGARSLI